MAKRIREHRATPPRREQRLLASTGRGRRNHALGAAQAWLGNHSSAAVETFNRLIRAPLGSLMTIATVAIALALPTAMFVMLNNLERLGGGWQHNAGLSLFLQPAIDEARAGTLAETLRARPGIARVDLISREQGLAEFREYSGLGGVLDQLTRNPLPVVLAVYPTYRMPPKPPPASRTRSLTSSLEQLAEVDFVRLDTQWNARLRAIVALLTNAALLLATVLALAVFFVVGNTIRLEIENRRTEIRIMDLVGATSAFIRRPYLYSGAWYGLLGGISAWLMVSTSIHLLQAPVTRLAKLYHTEFQLDGLGPIPTLILLGASMVLGILGSWLAVGRHLAAVKPG